MRTHGCSPLLAALLLVACGDDEPVEQPAAVPSPVTLAARADAKKAGDAYESIEGRDQVAPPKELLLARAAWKHGQQLENGEDQQGAAAAYTQAQRRFTEAARDVEEAVRRLRAGEERDYVAAVKEKAAVGVLHERLDSLRVSLQQRVAAATGEERALLELVLAQQDREMFRSERRRIADTAFDAGKTYFDGKRYAAARESCFEAATIYSELIERAADIEQRLRIVQLQRLIREAQQEAQAAYANLGIAPPPALRTGISHLDDGDAALERDDLDAARDSYAKAGESFQKAAQQAPLYLAKREEAARTRQAALKEKAEAGKAGSEEGTRALAEAEEHFKAERFGRAATGYRRARKAFAAVVAAAAKKREEAAAEDEARWRKSLESPAPKTERFPKKRSAQERIRLGLRWLALHQEPDGSWDADGFFKHDPPEDRCSGKGGAHYDVGVSSLALQAFLDAGYKDGGEGPEGAYRYTVKRALNWLRLMQDEKGCFGPRANKFFMYNTALATRAMCTAAKQMKDPRYKGSAKVGVAFLLLARNPYLGWRYLPRGLENDTSVTVMCVKALVAAREAGMEVSPDAFHGALKFIDLLTDPEYGQVGYLDAGGAPARPKGLEKRFPAEKSQAMTAAGILVRIFAGEKPDRKNMLIRTGVERCLEVPPKWNPDDGSIDMYYWYLGTEALALVGKTERSAWWRSMLPVALNHQYSKRSGSRTGSWDPIGVWGSEGGRVYSTALMTMILLQS